MLLLLPRACNCAQRLDPLQPSSSPPPFFFELLTGDKSLLLSTPFRQAQLLSVLMRFLTFQSMPFAAPQGPPGSCNGLTLIACWRTEAVPSRMIADPPVSTAVLVTAKIDLTHTNISARCAVSLSEHAHNHRSGCSAFLAAHTAPGSVCCCCDSDYPF